jgi:hypothetical protein
VNDIQTCAPEKSQFPPRTSVAVYIILALSFIAAGAARLYNVDSTKVYFNPTRQYYSFCIAKGFYCENTDSIPAWERKIAAINKEALDDKEPPVTEYLVSLIWRAAGSPNSWAPSVLASAFWLIGGIFVFLTAVRYARPLAAALATAFYLLAPFGIIMSRSFQPESLMIMMLMAGIYTIFRYYENQSAKRLLIASVVCAMAILAKVNIVFPIWFGFFAGGICKQGLRKTIFSRHHILFVLIGIGPAVAYYLYITLTTEIMRVTAESIFAPQLLWSSFFWMGWLNQLGFVIGYIPLTGAIAGICLVRGRMFKSLLAGFIVGYLAYGIIFTYTTPTQDYYQIPLIPITALALAPVISWFFKQLTQKNSPFRRAAIIFGLLLLTAFLGSLASIKKGTFRSDSKYVQSLSTLSYKSFGLNPRYLSQFSGRNMDFVKRAKDIGRLINHSDRTIILGRAVPLWYYGNFAGYRWPFHNQWPFPDVIGSVGTGAKWSKYQGLGAEELLEQHFAGYSPEYFIVTALDDFEKQTATRELLYRKFETVAQNDKYVIFDLTKLKQ